MNKPESLASEGDRQERPAFVSYATADRKEALSVCKAIERRGVKCWISTRDVKPGENYQEAIVRSIRDSRAMVLVFSDAANNSDEIKKELSLASRYRVPVMALRIEDVEPSDAFAYELSTRQWIDAFEGWDNSIETLVAQIGDVTAAPLSAPLSPKTVERPSLRASPRALMAAAAAGLLVLAGGGWWLMRPAAPPAHVMQVRLASFERLSPDLPATIPAAVRDELVSAFAQDGTITVSTASAPPAGSAPAFAISGTLRHDGDKVRAIARLTDERSGATIWSGNFDFPAKSIDKVPRWFAVNAAAVAKCGLFGASTYPKVLPEKTLIDYFSMCGASSQSQQLDIARRIVKETPDFSSAWSALSGAAGAYAQQSDSQRDALKKEAWSATETALRLDPQNSEAYLDQSALVPHTDFVAREALLKKAINARPLACGCEHHLYGWLLWSVGRVHDAADEFRQALDMEPFSSESQVNLAESLLITGSSRGEADQHYKAAADIVSDPEFLDDQKLLSAPITRDWAAALEVVASGREPGIQPASKTALVAAYTALISGNAAAKQNAAALIAALPERQKTNLTLNLQGALGDNVGALQQVEKINNEGRSIRASMWLWYPSMAGAIRDPSFPGVAQRLGLMRYWKTTHTKPDVCTDKSPPPFCGMI